MVNVVSNILPLINLSYIYICNCWKQIRIRKTYPDPHNGPEHESQFESGSTNKRLLPKGERSNVVHILFARDLLFIDPDDNKPLEEVCRFYKNDVNFVYQDTILTDMFDEFKSGDKGHMALVQEVNNEGEGDPFYETVGLVTLEDIIEEIIQQEIVDETDVVIDNKTKKKRKRERQIKDAEFKMFLDRKNHQRVIITPQISLAVYQFLTTWVKVSRWGGGG